MPAYDHCCFCLLMIPGTAPHAAGPDLSGWRINWTKGKLYDSRTCLVRYNVTVPRCVLVPGRIQHEPYHACARDV